MYPSVYTKYVLNVCTKSVYFILKGKINQINRHALKYVYKVDKILCLIACIKIFFSIQVTSGPEAEPPILKREPNPQVG